jgi:hypothetical protein
VNKLLSKEKLRDSLRCVTLNDLIHIHILLSAVDFDEFLSLLTQSVNLQIVATEIVFRDDLRLIRFDPRKELSLSHAGSSNILSNPDAATANSHSTMANKN